MRTVRTLILLVVAASLVPAHAGPAGQPGTLTFPVQQVSPLLEARVYLVPEEEQRRQFPDIAARLYGVALLPASDPYRGAWGTVLAKVMRPPMTADVWGAPGRWVTRLRGFVGGTWSDLNAQLVREGVALPVKEGDRVPYQAEAAEAARRGIGRHAYRAVAWFWANSTPMYALTVTPAPGLQLPLAIAMVNPSRIEAGYLHKGRVVLLPTEKVRLGSYVEEVIADGLDLTFVMKTLGLAKVTIRWRWDGEAYRFVRATEK